MPFTLLRVARRLQDKAAAAADAVVSAPEVDAASGNSSVSTVEKYQAPELPLALGMIIALVGLMILLSIYSTSVNVGKPRKKKIKEAAQDQVKKSSGDVEEQTGYLTRWERLKRFIALPALHVREAEAQTSDATDVIVKDKTTRDHAASGSRQLRSQRSRPIRCSTLSSDSSNGLKRRSRPRASRSSHRRSWSKARGDGLREQFIFFK
mmetsp:Transcript_36810/g.77568  ORF Transcript_36810/g.77568 Transcript_36810/m.77568 type:complete len:208 (-) Transcript_36810:169-792(-)